jgi:hypothetical protein
MDEVSDAALGTVRHQLVKTPGEDDYRQRCYREANSLFSRYSNLSAVMVSEFALVGMTHELLRNPDAAFPLAEGVIAEGRSSSIVTEASPCNQMPLTRSN